MDFPMAWEITLKSKDVEHNPMCSYRRHRLLCDCHVLHKHPDYVRAKEMSLESYEELLNQVQQLRDRCADLEYDLEFAYKRSKVLADLLEIPVHESPGVTGTILGLVRGKVERLLKQLEAARKLNLPLLKTNEQLNHKVRELSGVETQYCCWSQNDFEDVDTGSWATTCSERFYLTDETPADNGMNFCCYCGKPMIVSNYLDEEQSEI